MYSPFYCPWMGTVPYPKVADVISGYQRFLAHIGSYDVMQLFHLVQLGKIPVPVAREIFTTFYPAETIIYACDSTCARVPL